MANIATYLETQILNHVMRNIAYTSPATVYCGLVNSVATDINMEAGTLTNEITTYTGNRVPITFNAPTQVGGKATTSNTVAMEFENMPAITVKYAIICDTATGGNILWWCPLTESKTTNAGDTFRIPAGDMVIDLD